MIGKHLQKDPGWILVIKKGQYNSINELFVSFT